MHGIVPRTIDMLQSVQSAELLHDDGMLGPIRCFLAENGRQRAQCICPDAPCQATCRRLAALLKGNLDVSEALMRPDCADGRYYADPDRPC